MEVEHLIENMNDTNIKTMVFVQCVLMSVFILQKVIEYVFSVLKRSKEKEDKNVEKLENDVEGIKKTMSEIQASIASLTAKVDICLAAVFKVQKLEKDVHALGSKMRGG